ncbi:MAG TPA: ABC transporter permease [Gemmatimonadaceae bacterium]|nr:ABC transporter permease [Gemmatimonadaceae bacterium]
MRDPLHVLVLRLLLRLYPASFRRRHGDDVIASARAAAGAPGGGRPVAVLLDAAATLVRAWALSVRDTAPWLIARRAGSAFGRDARLGLRALRRRPMHGIVVVATLAVALGANAAIYTVTHSLLLDRLPYDSPERIVEVTAPPVRMVMAGGAPSWAVGAALVEHPGVEIAATYYPDASANLVADVEASRVRITQVSPTFFDVLGVQPLLGRGIGPDGATDAVLGYGIWRSAFGGDPGVLGRTIRLNGRSYHIAGVAPRGMDFPAGTQLWLSDPPVGEFFGSALGPSVVARLRPGALGVVRQALAEQADARRADSPEYAHFVHNPELIPLRAHLTQSVRLPLVVLASAAAAVLLLGCVNVAGVSLAQVAARAPELAVRRALGAGGSRLVGQLFAELTVLALLAGVLSVMLAAAAVPLLVGLLPAGTPGLDGVRPGVLTLLFTGAATVVAALVAGVPPALAGARGAGAAAHPDRMRVDERGRQRFQGVLTSVQIALAVMLVVSASLLGRSLVELRAVPLGYDTEHVLTFSVRLPWATYAGAADARRYAEEVRERLAALPGVEAVGVTDRLPLSEGMGVGGFVRRSGASQEAAVSATHLGVNDEYFHAMRIAVLAGRTFARGDDASHVVVLSRQLAQALFGDDAAVGSTVSVRRHGGEVTAVVAGVVADTRLRGVEEPMRPAVYLPLSSGWASSPAFSVRTSGSPAALAPAVRRVLSEVDATVPPSALRTTGAAVEETIAARRATAVVAILFGAASLLLALMAVYTLLAQGVVRRRREMGIRLALGATARQIEAVVVTGGLAWTVAGVVAGVLLSLAATRLLEGMLFGVAPRDPQVLAGTAAAVLIAAALASWIPARRAGRVDPAVSLRET